MSNARSARRRKLRNRFSVKAADVTARWTITVAGIGTILAVAGVCAFLVWVAAPLFFPAELTNSELVELSSDGATIADLRVNQDRLVGWTLDRQGTFRIFAATTGNTLAKRPLIANGPPLTAISSNPDGSVALGFSDGTVRLGRIEFKTTFPANDDVPANIRDLTVGEHLEVDAIVYERSVAGDLRAHSVAVELKDPVDVSTEAIQRIDHLVRDDGPIFVTLDKAGKLKLNSVREKENLLTGEVKLTANSYQMPETTHKNEPPQFVLLPGRGDNVLAAWSDGYLQRFDTRNPNEVSQVEDADLVQPDDAKLTSLELLLGRSTVLAGDTTGRVSAWFRVRPESKARAASDGWSLVEAHRLPGPETAVTAISTSSRARMATVGYADGQVRVFYVTNSRLLTSAKVPTAGRIDLVRFSPADDMLLAVSGQALWQAAFDEGHPHASLGSLFTPVWYEGYPQPDHVWQSGGGSEDFEPKLGLWPLVFGTLKATFYTMLLGAPLALLAAIYTSEFMHARTRARVKPTIEMMASLPSVVLGFLAALVFAPVIEQTLPVVIAAFVTVPMVIMVAAVAWQAMPHDWILRLQSHRLWFVFVVTPLGLLSAIYVAPVMERTFFADDVQAWLDGQVGSGVGGWLLLLLPLASITVAVLIGRWLNPAMLHITKQWQRSQQAQWSAAKLFGGALLSFALAWGVSAGLNALGFDPRGTYIDTYEHLNALIVGFAMGFAIIPIIFTLADDALSTVPRHLRSGSLGAGATTWQTTVRIVIPTAMSGLFSALMIGLGRAVGETMIVLMAAGNTPVRDWNIFNGFRTLSANLAVELPESARDSTHYRTLFLAALTLFALTFLVNTVAEVVRLRFRRRAYQL